MQIDTLDKTKLSCANLRLILVGPYPPPFGGIASHFMTLIPGLYAKGAEDIAVISFGSVTSISKEQNATIYRFNLRDHLKKLLSFQGMKLFATTLVKMQKAKFGFKNIVSEALKTLLINEIVTKHRSQVVSFYQSNLSCALISCHALWKNERGLVLTVFGEVYDDPKFFTDRVNFIEQFFSIPHSIVSSSKHCACSFKKAMGITRDIEAVYYGIDIERFTTSELRKSYREKLELNENNVLVVFMGRFNHEMGIGRVLEVVPRLLENSKGIKFLFAGAQGPLSKEALALAEKYPSKVTILQDVPFNLQPSIYAASDIVLAPSHDQHACMGMSIKEAMAASKPVIGSDAGGIPEAIVHGETGYLVPLDNTQHIDATLLIEYINKLVSDKDLRHKMGLTARRRAEFTFKMEKTIDRMGELFMAAIP